MSEVLAKPIEIAYPGVHKDYRGLVVKMSPKELADSVAWFNASGQRLPMVVAHPDDESEPLGFGTKLGIVNGDRVAIVEAEGIDPTFKKIVNSGELSRISAKIRLPGHPANKSSGFEFRHVGFFGKSPIAMDKLKEAAFSQTDKEFYLMPEDLEEKEAEFRQKEAEFQAKLDKLEQRQADLTALEAQFKRRQEIEPQIEKWLSEGRLLPIEKPQFVALFAAFPDELEVAFAASTGEVKTTPRKLITDFINSLKPRVVYGEVAKGELPDDDGYTASFMGMPVSEESDELDKKVCAYCKKNGMDENNAKDYAKALKIVGGN